MGNQMWRQVTVIGVFMASLGLMTNMAKASSAGTPAEFYRGKTLSWIVSSDPGSGTDIVTRTIAPFLSKEIGAKIKVENMKTDEGINYVYRQGGKDGLTLVAKSTDAVIGNEILKAPGVLYDTEKLNFVADIYPSAKMFQVSPKVPYRTIDDLRKAKGLKAGGTSAKGSLALTAAVMLEILKLDGKVITGFQGRKNLIMALARGEVDFMVTIDDVAMRDEQDGYIVNLFAAGDKRSEVVPHVPSLSELGVKVPKELENVHKFVSTGGMAVALPPGVPPERVEYLRKAFQNLTKDKELQKAVEKMAGAWRVFIPGKELQEEMAAMKRDTELAGKLDAIFKKYSAVR